MDLDFASGALRRCDCALALTLCCAWAAASPIDPTQAVGVLAAEVKYTPVAEPGRKVDDARAPELETQARRTGAWLDEMARSELGTRGLRTGEAVIPDDGGHAARCVRARPDLQALREAFQPACAAQKVELVLCQTLRADIGTEAGWSAIVIGVGIAALPRAGSSSVQLRAVVRDCATGEERWRGETLYRGLPQPDNKAFHDAMRGVFESIASREPKR